MPNTYHRIHNMRSDMLLGHIMDKGRQARFWFALDNRLVGIWKGRNGKTYAVGHNRGGDLIVFRTSPPQDNWANGSNWGRQ